MKRERYAVIGDPIDHSLSPAMHAAAFRHAGINAQYEAIRVSTRDLESTVETLRHLGFRGFNVTVPHKEAILPHLDAMSAEATAIHVVNTVVRAGDTLAGHNTDSQGFQAMLDKYGIDVHRKRVVVFGAGGAAQAVVHALVCREAWVTVVNRDQQRASRLAKRASRRVDLMSPHAAALPLTVRVADLLVNATSLGMGLLADQSPLPPDAELSPHSVVIDLVYGRLTPFLKSALAAGCRSFDGLEMLVQQGAESFRIWTGVEPDLGVMRAACARHIEEARSCSAS